MQAAARPYASLHTLYHNLFQPGPQDYELKKRYLALLPPQQIIDICLTFDAHVPPYIRGTVWPLDINVAIAALTKAPRPSDSTPSDDHKEADNVPVMDSLKDSEQAKDDRPTAEQLPPSTTAAVQSERNASSDDASTQSQQLPHPYAYPLPAAYPHAPYYPPPPAPYALHPHTAYPGCPPSGYPVTAASYPPNSYPNPSTPHPSQLTDPYNTHAGDDLPSYEDMIVEALMESNDPEGCAPKDLFAWMASHYPLQSNFRPSASQALQKAFKRGRFEKTSGGKYRLSTTWEGGSTSRRTTRRPQTISQSTTSSISTLPPPFTQTPLIHQNLHPAGARTPYIGQPFAYPYSSITPGYPPYSSLANTPPSTHAPTSGLTLGDGRPSNADKEAKEAYETAQNILRAINFGNLLEMSNEKDETSRENTTNPEAPEGVISQRSSVVAVTEGSGSAPPIVLRENEVPGPGFMATRAQLRAQLALLATQLAEIAEEQARAESEEDEMEAII